MINDNEIYNKKEEYILNCPHKCYNKDKLCHLCIDYSEYKSI